MSCPKCNSNRFYYSEELAEGTVFCRDCGSAYNQKNQPDSHETLKEIRDALKRIEKKIDDIQNSKPGDKWEITDFGKNSPFNHQED